MEGRDKLLLDRIQRDFPLAGRPFQIIAEDLGMTEAEVLERVQRLKASGHIRRVGATFHSKKLGYHSTLCALQAPPELTEAIAAILNAYAGVTHNYLREHAYNLWFTLIAPSRQDLEASLEEIRERTGVERILNLPAVQMFKLKVDFKMGGE